MMNRRRQYWAFSSLALAIIGLVIGAAWFVAPQIPDLMARASRIPDFSSNETILLSYSWPAPNEVVFSLSTPGLQQGSLRLDIGTGQTRTDPQIARFVPDLSPNGKYSLRSKSSVTQLISVNSGRVVQEWAHTESQWMWSPDSRGFAGVDSAKHQVRVYRLGQADTEVFRLPPLIGQPLWYDGKGRVCIAESLGGRSPAVSVLTLTSGGTASRREVRLPEGTAAVTDAQPSPDGSLVAWYLGRGLRQLAWLDRLLAYLTKKSSAGQTSLSQQPPPIDTEGIWISRNDGSGMRPIGEVRAEWAPAGMASFTWAPDGRSLLVAYRHGIYIVPLD